MDRALGRLSFDVAEETQSSRRSGRCGLPLLQSAVRAWANENGRASSSKPPSAPHFLSRAPRARPPEEEPMNDQERQVISDIFERLEQVANQPRDPEAERFIQEGSAEQPYAPYAMAQAIYRPGAGAARTSTSSSRSCRAEDEELRQPPAGRRLPVGIFGGGSREPERRAPGLRRAAAGRALDSGPAPQPDRQAGRCQARRRRGPAASRAWASRDGQPRAARSARRRAAAAGFLGTALSTAAGVAGGMMLGNVLIERLRAGAPATARSAAASAAARRPEPTARISAD